VFSNDGNFINVRFAWLQTKRFSLCGFCLSSAHEFVAVWKDCPAKPRTFVPTAIDLGDWAQIAPLFDQLETRVGQAKSVADLEKWLLDWSELNAALDEEASRRNIAMTCHTDDAEAEQAYLHFIENVEPQLKPRQFELEKLYVAHPQRKQLPKARMNL